MRKKFSGIYHEVKGYMKNTINPEFVIDKFRAEAALHKLFPAYSQNPIPSLSKSFIDKTPSPQADYVVSQIQAVGVLRKSDDANARMSVQEAVAAAPQVMAAADKLRAEVALHQLETNQPLAQ